MWYIFIRQTFFFVSDRTIRLGTGLRHVASCIEPCRATNRSAWHASFNFSSWNFCITLISLNSCPTQIAQPVRLSFDVDLISFGSNTELPPSSVKRICDIVWLTIMPLKTPSSNVQCHIWNLHRSKHIFF